LWIRCFPRSSNLNCFTALVTLDLEPRCRCRAVEQRPTASDKRFAGEASGLFPDPTICAGGGPPRIPRFASHLRYRSRPLPDYTPSRSRRSLAHARERRSASQTALETAAIRSPFMQAVKFGLRGVQDALPRRGDILPSSVDVEVQHGDGRLQRSALPPRAAIG